MIPKVIYQTWKTQKLHYKVDKLRKKMSDLNPDYELILYTDEQMNDFVNSNFDKDISEKFNSIKNIVSKADFWRYLILYKNGGVYLDIDSLILKNLESMIQKTDEAVITAEKNKNCFVQWSLIFDKNHPILESTINLLINNMVNNHYKNDVLNFSVKPYWDSVNDYLEKNIVNFKWNNINENTNVLVEAENSNARFYGVDYNNFIQFKHKYLTSDHWTVTQKKSEIY